LASSLTTAASCKNSALVAADLDVVHHPIELPLRDQRAEIHARREAIAHLQLGAELLEPFDELFLYGPLHEQACTR
jgi:hypothetical protein